MKKLIKLNIENTTNLREIEDSFCEVYSHDRNNGSFEFEITNDTLANETVTALFKFLRTGGYWKTTGTIEDNKIKVKFDTSLITQNEDVVCYLYLDDTERDSDIFSFKFRVKLSELDKSNQLVHKERYINNNVVIDRLNVVTHEDLEKVKSLIPVDVVNAEDLNREIKRIDALETKVDKDTVYDDSDLQERVKSLEDKPEVDIKNLATKEELDEVSKRQVTVDTSNLVTNDKLKDYALKTEIPQPYNDTDVTTRLTALENRPAGSGGNIDTSEFLTKQEFEDFQQTSSLIINEPMYDFFQKDSFKKDPEKDGYIGKLFTGYTPLIFKGERDNDLEYVEFQQLMRALIDVLPNGYGHYGDQKTTFLTDKNFKEMVATPEFKAVVKESLREIVKEIMREEN